MPIAVHFGAGRIGRGFLGQLLHDGDYLTTFVDADPHLVQALETRHEYPLRLVSTETTVDLRIDGLRALDGRQAQDKVVEALAEADLISTAVGVNVLPRIAPLLAAGIKARADSGMGPVDILLCENQWHAGKMMSDLLEPHLSPAAQDYFLRRVGLIETVIGRMVPAPTAAHLAEDPLLIVAEPYKELPIDRVGLKNTPPSLPGLILADNFEAYEARKLFLHNAGHAALAYLGALRGHEFIWQCLADPEIRSVCEGALAESTAALVAKYRFSASELQAFTADLLGRFANKALGDTVTRVAADPLRKLRADDRLVGAALLCLDYEIVPTYLAQIIAAALQYDNADDISSQELQALRRDKGDVFVLGTTSGVMPGTPLEQMISESLAKR